MLKQYFSIKRIVDLLFAKNISRLAFINSNSQISTKSKIYRFVKVNNSVVNEYSYIGANSKLTNCEIGKFCSISNNVIIGLGLHPIDYLSTSPIFFSPNNGTGIRWVNQKTYEDFPQRTIIGNDVWIGMNAVIMGNLRIGNGSIIATNAVVTKDVPAYAIVAGVPAKIIKYRFDLKTIERLEKIKWWNFPDDFFKNNLEKFSKPFDKKILEICERYIHNNKKLR